MTESSSAPLPDPTPAVAPPVNLVTVPDFRGRPLEAAATEANASTLRLTHREVIRPSSEVGQVVGQLPEPSTSVLPNTVVVVDVARKKKLAENTALLMVILVAAAVALIVSMVGLAANNDNDADTVTDRVVPSQVVDEAIDNDNVARQAATNLEDANLQIVELDEQRDALIVERDALVLERDALIEERDTLTAQVADTDTADQLADLETQVADLQSQLAETQTALDAAQTELDRIGSTVDMPDVMSQSVDDVRDFAADNNLEVIVVETVEGQQGQVTSQFPETGTILTEGSVLYVEVGTDTPPVTVEN